MSQLLILTEHIANLAATNSDVACGYVLIGTDVTIQLVHECLAEAHHFSIALTAGREVGTTFCTTHGQRGQRVLESLLESEELQDTEVHRLVETDSAFVRANGVVVLNTITHIGLDVTLVISPSNAELNQTIGDAQTLDEV